MANHPLRLAALGTVSIAFLAGCATKAPVSQSLSEPLKLKIGTAQTYEGVKQNELYATFNRSNAGAVGASACGAVPGIGVLLAGVCGGIAGASDAAVNESRAKDADLAIRPLKDEIIDFNFDESLRGGLTQSLASVNYLHGNNVKIIKQVSNDNYEQLMRDSSADVVLFLNADYHLSTDFSTLIISTQALAYPRSVALRAEAGQDANPGAHDKITDVKNAIYRKTVTYEAHLPHPGTDIQTNVGQWKQGGAILLRQALNQGVGQLTTVLATDLQKQIPVTQQGARTIKVGAHEGSVVAESGAGQLVIFQDGSITYLANLAGGTSMANALPVVPSVASTVNKAVVVAPAAPQAPAPEAIAPAALAVASPANISEPVVEAAAISQPAPVPVQQNAVAMTYKPAVSNQPFKTGVSSVTVEKLAKQMTCQSAHGASLVSQSDKVIEDYSIDCTDGRQLVAHCEYRQCTLSQLPVTASE